MFRARPFWYEDFSPHPKPDYFTFRLAPRCSRVLLRDWSKRACSRLSEVTSESLEQARSKSIGERAIGRSREVGHGLISNSDVPRPNVRWRRNNSFSSKRYVLAVCVMWKMALIRYYFGKKIFADCDHLLLVFLYLSFPV